MSECMYITYHRPLLPMPVKSKYNAYTHMIFTFHLHIQEM
jgi:hypothetical protein